MNSKQRTGAFVGIGGNCECSGWVVVMYRAPMALSVAAGTEGLIRIRFVKL